jgi:hypothetical protein
MIHANVFTDLRHAGHTEFIERPVFPSTGNENEKKISRDFYIIKYIPLQYTN